MSVVAPKLQQDELMVSADSPNTVLHQEKKNEKLKPIRKKLDSVEKQIHAINLNRLSLYKDYIYSNFGEYLTEYSSVSEIMTFKDLIERGVSQ